MKNRLGILILAAAVSGAGCSSLTTKEIDKPVVVQSLKEKRWFWNEDRYETVLLTPERRQVLIKYNSGGSDIICSEAPSDSGLKIDTLINASIRGEIPASGSGKAALNNQSNTANIALHNQVQSIKFLTAASHIACNMYMNGAITAEEYSAHIAEIIRTSIVSLEREIPIFYDAMKSDQANASTSESVGDPNEANKGKRDSVSVPQDKARAILFQNYYDTLNPKEFDNLRITRDNNNAASK